jgi:hypothetical protein
MQIRQSSAPGCLPRFLTKTILHTDLFSCETVFLTAFMLGREEVFCASHALHGMEIKQSSGAEQ